MSIAVIPIFVEKFQTQNYVNLFHYQKIRIPVKAAFIIHFRDTDFDIICRKDLFTPKMRFAQNRGFSLPICNF